MGTVDTPWLGPFICMTATQWDVACVALRASSSLRTALSVCTSCKELRMGLSGSVRIPSQEPSQHNLPRQVRGSAVLLYLPRNGRLSNN